MVVITDRNSLLDIFKVFHWFDIARWSDDNANDYINYFRDDLTPSEKILTHWLTGITNRQKPYRVVWSIGANIFSELVHRYSREPVGPEQILNEFYDGNENRFVSPTRPNISFSSRWAASDYQSIKQTLQILNNNAYGRNIVSFAVARTELNNHTRENFLRVACALHLLSYTLANRQANADNAIAVLNDDAEFAQALETFTGHTWENKKRLWCCLRDYKKGNFHQIFLDGIGNLQGIDVNAVQNTWNGLPLNTLELPGDVWNNNTEFRNRLFGGSINLDTIPNRWSMPRVIRDLYCQCEEEADQIPFYPEQFDVSFNFVPRMCQEALCDICPFGPNGASRICIPTEDRYCPVALVSCGYRYTCDQEACIINQGVGCGKCNGLH